MITKQVDTKGRITLDKSYAGTTMLIEQRDDGTITLHPAVTVPAKEAWLWKDKKALALVLRGLEDARRGISVPPPDLSSPIFTTHEKRDRHRTRQTKPRTRAHRTSKAQLRTSFDQCDERQLRAHKYLEQHQATIDKPISSKRMAVDLNTHEKTLRKWVLNPMKLLGVRSCQNGFYLEKPSDDVAK